MKKRIIAATVTGMMVLAMSSAQALAADNLTLATGGTTGTYYAVGGVMATVLNDKLENSSLTVTSTGASKANIQLIDDEDAQLGIVQNDVMYYAYTGTDLFEDEGAYDTFQAVALVKRIVFDGDDLNPGPLIVYEIRDFQGRHLSAVTRDSRLQGLCRNNLIY